MTQTLFVLAVFGFAIVGLALGVIVKGPKGALKGSCGGPGVNPDCCQTCPDKPSCDDDIERELQRARKAHPLLPQVPASHGESGRPVGARPHTS